MGRERRIAIHSLQEIADLDKVVYKISLYINQIHNAGSDRIAEILEEISLKILTDPRLEKRERQKAIKNLHRLAREASFPPKKRSIGNVKAAIPYIRSLLISGLDRDLRTHFGIS